MLKKRIADVACKLGIDLSILTLGKVHECIRSDFPEVFNALSKEIEQRRKREKVDG